MLDGAFDRLSKMDVTWCSVASQLLDAHDRFFGHGLIHFAHPMADADGGLASHICRHGRFGRFVDGHDLSAGARVGKVRIRLKRFLNESR